MLTGVETAGLVLAALPLIISALESYKDGLQTIKRLYYSEAELRKLVRTLKVQGSKYRTNLEKLIKAAAPELGIQELPDDYSDEIWHGNLNAKAKIYLGERYEAFKITVEDYHDCIKEIARKLRHINRPKTADKADLQALLDGNAPQHGRFTWVKKVDFTMKQKDLTQLTGELDNSNFTLGSFISDSDMLERLSTRSTDMLRAQALSNAFSRIRLEADSLHSALVNARLPGCDLSHRVMLHLDDRLPPKNTGQTLRGNQPISFCLSVAWESQNHASVTRWHQTTVAVPQGRSTYQVPVEDICRLIDQAQQLNQVVKFHLLDQELLRFCDPQLKAEPAVREIETITLHQILESRTRLMPKESTILALKLASSLLQLNFTAWLERHWTKKGISFFRLSSPSIVYMGQPLLEKVFHKQRNAMGTNNPGLGPKVALFEFGILLMELWTQTSFEHWMSQRGTACRDDSYYARIPVAIQWFDEEEAMLPLGYRSVTSRCLKFSFEGLNASWDDQAFREAVCVNVIEPLQKTCEIW